MLIGLRSGWNKADAVGIINGGHTTCVAGPVIVSACFEINIRRAGLCLQPAVARYGQCKQ